MTPIEAGRELDALIAEKVMGFSRVLPGEYWNSLVKWRFERDVYEGCPDYSTDIADAWTVYLKVMEGPFSQRTRFYQALQMQTRAHMDSERLAAWPDVLTVLRHEMPLAICRAALYAVSQPVAASDADAAASQD